MNAARTVRREVVKGLALLLACVAPAARGEELPLWELGVGAAGISFPDYRGSSRQRGYVLPVPAFAYRGEVFQVDREKLREYSELYKRLGGYPYDQDPGRPGWTPIVPNDRWADPKDDRPVAIPH